MLSAKNSFIRDFHSQADFWKLISTILNKEQKGENRQNWRENRDSGCGKGERSKITTISLTAWITSVKIKNRLPTFLFSRRVMSNTVLNELLILTYYTVLHLKIIYLVTVSAATSFVSFNIVFHDYKSLK